MPRRWSVSCWKIRASRPSARISIGSPCRSRPRSRTRTARVVSWYGPGIDRHPSSIVSSSSSSDSSGSATKPACPSRSSYTKNERPMPTWLAANPTPGAAYIVSNMSSEVSRSASSKVSTGFVGSRRTGSPSVRIGITVTVAPPRRSSQVRFGLDARHHAPDGKPPHRVAERSEPRGVEDDQAYRRVLRARDEQGSGGQGFELALELGAARHAEHRRPHREPGLGATRRLGPVEPVGPARDQRLDRGVVRRVRLDDHASVAAGPRRRPEPCRQRPLAGVDAWTMQRGVRVQDADAVERLRPEVLPRVEPAHQHLALAHRSRVVLALRKGDRHRRDRTGPLLHAFGAAPNDTEVGGPARYAPPRRLADDAPDRSVFEPQHPPAGGTRGGLAARAADAGHAVAADGFEQERPDRLPQSADQARRPALGPRPDDLDGRPRSRRRLDEHVLAGGGAERLAG